MYQNAIFIELRLHLHDLSLMSAADNAIAEQARVDLVLAAAAKEVNGWSDGLLEMARL